MIKTKIICTIGPSVNTLEKMIELMQAGMNVARLNFSHGTQLEHRETIENLKKAREIVGEPLAIMLDTKGPEIRLGKIAEGLTFLRKDQRWRLLKQEMVGDAQAVSLIPPFVVDELKVGDRILFDDGYIASHVVESNQNGEVVVSIHNEGVIRSDKGVNIPAVHLHFPSMTDQDVEDIAFGCRLDVDIIAASFVRSAEQVTAIKDFLAQQGRGDILVLAKIENREGVENFDRIVQVADGIIVARGDLGVEVPLCSVPKLQKMMIKKSYLAGKPVVTATQMLESMIHSPRPTRAEVSDVANAVFDSTSAVMLSGETAIGRYPVEAVAMMRQIIEEAELGFDYVAFFEQHSQVTGTDIVSAVTLATVKTAYLAHAKALFAFTRDGETARLLSRLRPKMPIVVLADSAKKYHQLAIHWGITPLYQEKVASFQEGMARLSRYAREKSLILPGDVIVGLIGDFFEANRGGHAMVVEKIDFLHN